MLYCSLHLFFFTTVGSRGFTDTLLAVCYDLNYFHFKTESICESKMS